MGQGGWDGGGGGMERQRDRKRQVGRQREARGWTDEDQHDVVPQPGKKRNKQKQEARTRQTSLNYRAET